MVRFSSPSAITLGSDGCAEISQLSEPHKALCTLFLKFILFFPLQPTHNRTPESTNRRSNITPPKNYCSPCLRSLQTKRKRTRVTETATWTANGRVVSVRCGRTPCRTVLPKASNTDRKKCDTK